MEDINGGAVNGLVLSLFPGIGLLDMAFEEEGFCVVRGPDLLWGGDIRRFHPPAGRFDGVIGGPPCQLWSRFRHLNPNVGKHGNLIPEFERCAAEADPAWFVMENVPDAPTPAVEGYVVADSELDNRWVGAEQSRRRRFSFGTRDGRSLDVEVAVFEAPLVEQAVVSDARSVPVAIGGSGKPKAPRGVATYPQGGAPRRTVADMNQLQGLEPTFLSDAPFTVQAKRHVIANGVPLPMGRAIARAVKRALDE